MLVQIYSVILIAIWFYLGYTKHGEPIELAEPDHDFRKTFTSFLLYIPIFGRVFNWW